MKILVIYATAGAGHRKAAEAIYQGLQKYPSHQSRCVDALDYTNPLYKYIYPRFYAWLVSRVPAVWAFFFRLLDVRPLLPLTRFLRRVQNTIQARALKRFLVEEQFDYIFSTHFFPSEVAAYLKRRGSISSRIVCSITDFDVHSIWLNAGVDEYTVACEWTKRKLMRMGVAGHQVRVTGIPTDERFALPKDTAAVRRRMGLRDRVMTVLISTGSFGIGPIEELIDRLNGFQLIVVCGHNQTLYQTLRRKNKDLVHICGLVDNMDELMAAADVMVTKPGGLSISEALVTGLPMVFFNAIPGQETNNINVLHVHGIGAACGCVADIGRVLREYQSSPDRLKEAKDQTRILARPGAARDVVDIIALP